MSWSLGLPDGQNLSREEAAAAVARIAAAVDLPVTADIESGYGTDPADVAATVAAVIEAGAVGINLEDSGAPGGGLFDPAAQAARIRAARAAAADAGLPELVINARTDVFLFQIGQPEGRLDDVLARAAAYAAAGADSLFVPGLLDLGTLATLTGAVALPVNVMVGPGAPDVAALGAVGVRRVSLGQAITQAALHPGPQGGGRGAHRRNLRLDRRRRLVRRHQRGVPCPLTAATGRVMSDKPSGNGPAPPGRQGDLFEDLEPAVDAGFATAERIELDETSWIEYVPRWLQGSAGLFDELTATAQWEQRYRYMYGRRLAEPRLTAEYADIDVAPQRLLRTITEALSEHYGVAYRYRVAQPLPQPSRLDQLARGPDREGPGDQHRAGAQPRRRPALPHQARRGRPERVADRRLGRPDRHGRARPARLAALGAQAGHPGRPADQHQLRPAPDPALISRLDGALASPIPAAVLFRRDSPR